MLVRMIDFGAEQFPVRKHPDDFGADVFMPYDDYIPAHCVASIPLGFGLEVPFGYAGYIEPRGSVGKLGLMPVSNPIDSGYRGEVHAVMRNVTDNTIYLKKGDRIAQLVIHAGDISEFDIIKPYQASATERGAGCYGSTDR